MLVFFQRTRLILFAALFYTASLCAQEINDDIDPWEPMNRAIFSFNKGADTYFLRPIAQGYNWIMPSPLNRGVTNFFDNTFEVNTMLNSGLQAKPGNFGLSFSRFLINATLGFFGLFDVATELGVHADVEDFGQTFAHWGIGSGPYLVIPFLGPSNVRDGIGLIPNIYINPLIAVDNDPVVNYARLGLYLIDLRADLIEAEDLITGDEYIFMRNAYLQNREFLINDGAIEDSFGDDLDESDDWLDDDF